MRLYQAASGRGRKRDPELKAGCGTGARTLNLGASGLGTILRRPSPCLMDAGVHVTRLDPHRSLTRDILEVSSARHVIHGLVEVDVTVARRRLGGLSFTAFVVHCFALALSREAGFNCVRRGRHLHSFDAVNVGTMVESEENGVRYPVGFVVRDAARKSVLEIHDEIRRAQQQSTSELARQTGAGWFIWMPGFVRRAAVRFMLGRPGIAHEKGLVASVTSVGMFGGGAGWGIAITPSTVALTVGGIGHRPVLVDGRLEEHEYLCLTISFDHDLIDGAPAARFTAVLVDLIEKADGLELAVVQQSA